MSEFIVEFDYICVKHNAKLRKFKHFKYWFGVRIILVLCEYIAAAEANSARLQI